MRATTRASRARAAPSRGETRGARARRLSRARRRAIDARASAPMVFDAVAQFVASVDETPRDVAASALTTIGAFVWVKAFDALADRGAFASTTSRKLVHVTSGTFFACTWPLFSASGAARFFAAAIPLAQGVRLFGIGSGMIKNASAVRAVSREGGKEELLKGPLYYTAVLAACTSAYWRTNPIGIVAMAMMCGGDGFADLVGRKFGKGNALPWNEEKSFAGSAGFVAGGFGVASGCVSIDTRIAILRFAIRARYRSRCVGVCFRRARVRSISKTDIAPFRFVADADYWRISTRLASSKPRRRRTLSRSSSLSRARSWNRYRSRPSSTITFPSPSPPSRAVRCYIRFHSRYRRRHSATRATRNQHAQLSRNFHSQLHRHARHRR